MDILKKLRDPEYVLSDKDFVEAADEIDRLRDCMKTVLFIAKDAWLLNGGSKDDQLNDVVTLLASSLRLIFNNREE